MARAGRKRKAGLREPSGKIRRPSLQALADLERSKRMTEMATVLAQPHRKGDTRQECATALGRLWISLKTDDPSLLHAGEAYGRLVRRYRRAWGLKTENMPREPMADEPEPTTMAEVEKWRAQIDHIEFRMMGTSFEVLSATRRVAIDGVDLVGKSRNDALIGLRIIAVAWGMVPKDHPFR